MKLVKTKVFVSVSLSAPAWVSLSQTDSLSWPCSWWQFAVCKNDLHVNSLSPGPVRRWLPGESLSCVSSPAFHAGRLVRVADLLRGLSKQNIEITSPQSTQSTQSPQSPHCHQFSVDRVCGVEAPTWPGYSVQAAPGCSTCHRYTPRLSHSRTVGRDM